jgi:hypothetical protein
MLNTFIELKRKCELIVTETDLTNVLSVLDTYGNTKMDVSIYRSATKREDTEWRVAFRATACEWAWIVEESKEVCANAILKPLKDSFGHIEYHKA